MLQRKTLPKVLLMLAMFVFLSANTVHFVETDDGSLWASTDRTYHFDFDSLAHQRGPYLNLKAAIAVDYSNGKVLYSRNADEQRPIASLTKLVTAMVVLDKGLSLDSVVTITREDSRRSAKSRLRTGYQLTVGDLLYEALMQSDNRSARALARAAHGTIEAFTAEMNKKVRQLGLKKTVFFEPTGLDARNVSTAHEIAKILHYAYDYRLIREITSQRSWEIRIRNRKNRKLRLANTNLMIHSPHKVLAGKTGYIQASDYCLATILRNKEGKRLTVVVLGVPRDRLRFRECRRLADWGFKRV
ncbi:MAG: D-alanyl-D-alanine carboxypeptidase [Candidatus Zixiibacteriota bacterium]|nr:MAG: D-alanyl-D-alanine carboxypeptidase [candidate division Zixibacteria bacterium]